MTTKKTTVLVILSVFSLNFQLASPMSMLSVNSILFASNGFYFIRNTLPHTATYPLASHRINLHEPWIERKSVNFNGEWKSLNST